MSKNHKLFIKRVLWLTSLTIIFLILTITIILYPAFWLDVYFVIEPWLWLIITIISIIVVYKLVIFLIKRKVKKSKKFPQDATNGLILVTRLITIFALIFVIMSAINIPSEYLLDISTILATAIGFASTIAVSNIIAGFYMIASNPYNIGDFISINESIEGIVKEIGLNYTKIQDISGVKYQIANNKLLSSNITNFKVEHTKATEKETSLEEKFVSLLSDIMISDEIVSYVFEVEIALELDSEETIDTLDKICERWKDKFGYKPAYFFKSISWRGTVQWNLLADRPETIMNLKDEFLEDIWLSIYKYRKEMT